MKRSGLFLLLGMIILSGNLGCSVFKFNSGAANDNANSGNSNTRQSNTSANSAKIDFSSGALLGKWSEKNLSSHTLEFKEDGTLTIVYQGKTIQNKYTYISDSQIKEIEAKGKARSPKFTVNGDEMTLIWTDMTTKDNTQHYVRFKEKPSLKPKK